MSPRQSHPARKEALSQETDLLNPIRAWFGGRGWNPYPFQVEAWEAHLAGRSGLIHVPTGAGKTYAAYMGPLASLLAEATSACGEPKAVPGLRVLLVTPLRAVSRDTALALRVPIEDLGFGEHLTVETRTGDTASSVRARQAKRLPNVLVTTPESLSLLLTRPDARKQLGSIGTLIIDEWHELLSSKRGTQVELAAARLRKFNPYMRTWALSATIANLDEAAQAAVGVDTDPALISADIERPVVIESVLPQSDDRFPWAGHMGLTQLDRVLDRIELGDDGLPRLSTLVFVNTRNQAERWFNAIAAARPSWEGVLGLHHGSIDRAERERVESGLKTGTLRLVVATSSLDLGVDFAPVERVMQIGSPKGIARLMQRAGRASHRPGAECRILCVPTNALEFLEVAAVRRALRSGTIEPRAPEDAPLDVLAQHLVTLGLGESIDPEEVYMEVRSACAYRHLTRKDFDWTLDLVTTGGETLKAYPEYRKLAKVEADEPSVAPRYQVADKRIAQLHKMNIGSITGDAVMDLRYYNGKRLGFIEESFIDKLRPGEKFVFAGKVLSYRSSKDLVAFVRPATGKTNHTPVWGGTRLPISESLSEAVRNALEAAGSKDFAPEKEPELAAAGPLIETQRRLSSIPSAHETLVETTQTRDGSHMFMFPFEGRLVHGGLAAIVALRLGRLQSGTFSTAANDYGFELLAERGYPFGELLNERASTLFSLESLLEDAAESVDLSALAKSQFREVARVAGLVFQSVPGAPRSMRQVQARSSLIFEVFEEFDPQNLLLHQARREVMSKQFERSRLARTLHRLNDHPIVHQAVDRPTPLSLPLVIERVGARLTTETLIERIEKMKAQWDSLPVKPRSRPRRKGPAEK